MLAYFRLIRWFNLLMMAFTMVLTRKFLLETFVQLKHLELSYPDLQFFLVIASTALLSAGGYIVNDIFDREADRINKPERQIVGMAFSTDTAWKLYWIHTILGAGIGVYLAFHIQIKELAIVPLMIAGLLWFYTTSYKKLPLVGNVIISLFTGCVPLVVGLFEQIAERRMYKIAIIDIRFVAGYAVFAFLISMIREIVKDLEDIDGDRDNDCTTIPIAWGINVAKAFGLLFSTLLFAALTYLEYIQYTTKDFISLGYFLVAVSLPLLLLMFTIISAKSKKNYTMASNLSKVVMLTGICSMIVFWFTLRPYLNPVVAVPEVMPQVNISVGK